jgi:hypothetical protein
MKKLIIIIFFLFLSQNIVYSQSPNLIFLKCTSKTEYKNQEEQEKLYLEHYFTINKKESLLYYEAYKDVKGKIEKLNRKIILQPSPKKEDNKIYLTFGTLFMSVSKKELNYIYYDIFRFNIVDIEKNGQGRLFNENNLVTDVDGKSIIYSEVSNCVREKSKFN